MNYVWDELIHIFHVTAGFWTHLSQCFLKHLPNMVSIHFARKKKGFLEICDCLDFSGATRFQFAWAKKIWFCCVLAPLWNKLFIIYISQMLQTTSGGFRCLFGFTYSDSSWYPFVYECNNAYMLKVHKIFAVLVDGQRAHQNNSQHSFSLCKSAGFQITHSCCCIAILLRSWWAISSSKHCVSSGSELHLRMPIDYQRRLTFIITRHTPNIFSSHMQSTKLVNWGLILAAGGRSVYFNSCPNWTRQLHFQIKRDNLHCWSVSILQLFRSPWSHWWTPCWPLHIYVASHWICVCQLNHQRAQSRDEHIPPNKSESPCVAANGPIVWHNCLWQEWGDAWLQVHRLVGRV